MKVTLTTSLLAALLISSPVLAHDMTNQTDADGKVHHHHHHWNKTDANAQKDEHMRNVDQTVREDNGMQHSMHHHTFLGYPIQSNEKPDDRWNDMRMMQPKR